MNKIRIILVLLCLTTVTVSAQHYRHHRNHRHHRRGCVATPLDGGLLSVLGAAGIGYYLFRKNKKEES